MDLSWALIFAGAVLVAGSLFYAAINARLQAMETRIKTLNEKINRLTDPKNEKDLKIVEELRQLKNDGETIKAVKEARKAFGFTLLEAKQYIDSL